jgi:arylsulfatase
LNDDERRMFVRMAEVFAGYVAYYDDRLGRVLDYLDESGELDNTLIVVVSDNGGSGEGGPNGSFNEWRFFNGVPDTVETTLPHLDELGTPASNNHYNTGWAWAFDTPFPYWKRWAGEEGGTADMCIVSWPAQVPADPSPRQQYLHAVDIVPTVYELLGIEPPEVINGYLQSPIEGESFAAALTDPTVPGKRTQFYTMLGQRSLYHDGWLVSTVHPPLSSWGNFGKDEWELFHLSTDRSQCHNVAADHPDKVEELKALWFYYAGIYDGLPLDDRNALEQVLAERPRGAPERDRYVFYPNCSDVPESAGPQIPGRSFTIAAHLSVTSADVQGVIWAAGGVPGGHSLYVKDGRLRYTFNWVGTVLQDVVADSLLPAGDHLCVAEFVAAGPNSQPDMPGTAGTLTLYVDDEPVGSGPVVTQPGYFCLTGDGICVGRDSASAVTPEYTAPFPFTGGVIDRVVLDVSGDGYANHEQQVRAWFGID